MIRLLQSPEELARYDTWVRSHPHGTLWQSLEWKSYQERLGREVRIYAEDTGHGKRNSGFLATALVIIDKTVFGLSTWDIPRGPLGRVEQGTGNMEHTSLRLLEQILSDARKNRCMSVYLSPMFHSRPSTLDSRPSSRHEQPEATRIVDLSLSEEEILKQMHQKGRYNIKVAQKHTVRIERSDDVEAYAALAKKTAGRDGFTGASKRQYEEFLKMPGSFMLVAYEATGDIRSPKPEARSSAPIAGLIGIAWNGTGIYYYGASDYEHRNLMAPYLLQWEAMKLCKEAGCTSYDLLGIAPIQAGSDQRLAASINTEDPVTRYPLPAHSSSHPWAGISAFKEKFGGTIVTYPPEREIRLRPMVKRMLAWKRRLLSHDREGS